MKKKLTIQEQFPDLFPENFGIECGQGWNELIKFVCFTFYGFINRKDVENIKFAQIKEKFGLLRIYFDINLSPNVESPGTFDELHNIIYTVENISGLVCEDCGKIKNKKFTVTTKPTRHGWIRTLCDKCFEKEKKRKI